MKAQIFIIALFLALFLWLGESFYFNTLDEAIFPPFTFKTDQMNLKTDKDLYHPGDAVSIQNSFCRNRNFTVVSTWKLFNGTVITFPSSGVKVVTAMCVKDQWFVIGTIPSYATKGTHHLEATAEVQLNPQKKVYLNFKSQNFDVE